MALRYRYHPAVQRELMAAVEWYNAQQAGLGDRFYREVRQQISNICYTPEIFPHIQEPYRKAVMRSFPYYVIYEILEKEIYIYSVFHEKRHPEQ